jgi:hypothetical protein
VAAPALLPSASHDQLQQLDEQLVLHCLFVASGVVRYSHVHNKERLNIVLDLYFTHVEPALLPTERLVPRTDLANPLRYSATRILTAYRNQISCHFLRFLNKLKRKDPAQGPADAESVLYGVEMSDQGLAYDVAVEPLKFLPSLIRLHEQFRRRGWKLFQCFPLCRSNIPTHLTADTTSLRGWVGTSQTAQLSDEELWATYLRQPLGFGSRWRFDGTFQTDGVAVTFLFEMYVPGYQQKRGRKKKAKKEDLFDDGIRRFGTLTADELAGLLDARKAGTRFIYVDPGKRDLLTMMDDDENFCRYVMSVALGAPGVISVGGVCAEHERGCFTDFHGCSF